MTTWQHALSGALREPSSVFDTLRVTAQGIALRVKAAVAVAAAVVASALVVSPVLLATESPAIGEAALFVLATAAAASAGAYLALGRLVLEPLRELTAAIAEVSQGHLHAHVHVPERDEFDTLAQSFNAMVDRLCETTISRDHLENVLESMQEALILATPGGEIFRLNSAALRILGYSAGELRGRPVETVLRYTRSASSPHARLFEGSLVPKCGPLHAAQISRAEVRESADGEPLVLWVAQDISERKRAEQRIRALNQSLELRVRARTDELESFSYAVSHDLRQPLRSVDGFLAALSEETWDDLSEESRSYLQRARGAATRMDAMIDSLRSLSKVGQRSAEIVDVNLGESAALIVAELEDAADAHMPDVVIEESLLVQGDRDLLHLVMQNLLGNAWKFTRNSDAPRIEIGREIAADDTPVYFVADNGAGFDMKQNHRLFQTFSRLHRDEEFEGSGVGLATVRRIVALHGGRVWAEGEPGRGATFRFTLGAEPEILREANAA